MGYQSEGFEGLEIILLRTIIGGDTKGRLSGYHPNSEDLKRSPFLFLLGGTEQRKEKRGKDAKLVHSVLISKTRSASECGLVGGRGRGTGVTAEKGPTPSIVNQDEIREQGAERGDRPSRC